MTPLQVHTMPNADIRLIVLDLDGTLLNSDKELTPRNAAALTRAADAGIEIVPATGRFFNGMPEAVRKLPFLHYAITINGAMVYDIKNDNALVRAEIPLDLAESILRYVDRYPVAYDCYQNNWGYISADFREHIEEYTPDVHYQEMARNLRKQVPELKEYLREQGKDVQKIILYVPNSELHQYLMTDLQKQFPETSVTSSISSNIEINIAAANKGNALSRLSEKLGFRTLQTAAFGDGFNDVTMLQTAGIGIAMANAVPEAKAAAKYITDSCDEDGVAKALEKFDFKEGVLL